MNDADTRYLDLAIGLGARRLGQVWPNPAVGCVLVRDGRIVGRGATAPGGRPHAETTALDQAGPEARGATAYVSLEPCAHHGETPPCTSALIGAGVVRVVSAAEDPDPRVAGKGHGQLRDAGISVEIAEHAPEAARVHRGFFLRVRRGRPMVTLKLAASFDGRIATASGESRWITGPGARRRVHAARAAHDLVLVGGGTARADDPDLSVRGFGEVPQPVRAVAARSMNLPPDGRMARSARASPVWILHDPTRSGPEADLHQWATLGVDLVPVASAGAHLDPSALLQALGDRGITRVFCEGGGALAASLLQAGLVDEIMGFTAGLMLGAEGQPSLGALGIGPLSEAPRFTLRHVEQVAEDILHIWERPLDETASEARS